MSFSLFCFIQVAFLRIRRPYEPVYLSGNMCLNDSNGDSCAITERQGLFLVSSTIDPELERGSTVDLSMLPIDMTFNDGHVVSITTYSVLLIISVCGNITVLVNLIKRRHISNPRVNIMLTHLAIADLLVSLAEPPFTLLVTRSDILKAIIKLDTPLLRHNFNCCPILRLISLEFS